MKARSKIHLLPKNTPTGMEDEGVASRRPNKGPTFHHEKAAATFRHRSFNSKEEEELDLFDVVCVAFDNNRTEGNYFLSNEVHRTKLKTNQPETDSSSDWSKPLKIDPGVLELDFSRLSNKITGDCRSSDELYLSVLFEVKRGSHHLSGGSFVTDVSRENLKNSSNDSLNSNLYKPWRVGLTAKNVLKLKNSIGLNLESGRVQQFSNRTSPSSSFAFDLIAEREQQSKPRSGTSSEAESTNPFKPFTGGTSEGENVSPPTNPFSDFCSSPSPEKKPSAIDVPSRNENILLPRQSFSQRPARSASPVSKAGERSSVSNPFLINDTSPELSFSGVPHPFTNKSKFPDSANPLPDSSSFIFAVPVFSILGRRIINSSTQTVDPSEVSKLEEPAYQNVTNHLRKLMKGNDRSEYDLQRLKGTVKDLRNSGWYHENVSWQESVVLLTDAEPGTFLIRDSSDPNFLFSLSVQTPRGPTSVRIHYENGHFRLDADERLIPHLPFFNSVTELIDYYVEKTVKNKSNCRMKTIRKPSEPKLQKSKEVWVDSQGNIYSSILLVKPLYKRNHFSTLQHLARLTINRLVRKRLNAKISFNLNVGPVYESSPLQDSFFQNDSHNFGAVSSIGALPLPERLLEYLKEYPFCH